MCMVSSLITSNIICLKNGVHTPNTYKVMAPNRPNCFDICSSLKKTKGLKFTLKTLNVFRDTDKISRTDERTMPKQDFTVFGGG